MPAELFSGRPLGTRVSLSGRQARMDRLIEHANGQAVTHVLAVHLEMAMSSSTQICVLSD